MQLSNGNTAEQLKMEGHMTSASTTQIYGVASSSSKFQFLRRLSFRFFAVLFGLGLMGYLVFRSDPGGVWKQVQAVGWGLVVIFALGGFAQFIKTCAWRQTFMYDISGLSWPRSLGTQLASDAMGQLGVAGKAVGEGIRVSLIGSAVPVSNRISATMIDGSMHMLTAAFVTTLGITATLLFAPLSRRWRADVLVLAVVLISVVILAAVAVARRWQLLGNLARVVGRLPFLHWVSDKQSIIDSAESNLLTFCHEAPSAFMASMILNLLWHALAVLEIYLILRFMGERIPLIGAFVVEGLTKVINLVGAFNPGNLGTYEGGNILIAKMFGVTGTAGLTLALCRRMRSIFWAGVGAVCMMVMKRT
jgi:Lysylphosphatidylglycerol synthase TM region